MEYKIKANCAITNTSGKLSYTYKPFTNLVKNQEGYNKIYDFDTDKLNLDLNHPVSIEPQYSYDGSVDLILSDNKNTPKLINSRFRVSENDEFEFVHRLGNKVENIYNDNTLLSDISLQKTSNKIAKVDLLGTYNDGELSIGNYVFYFKYSDGDGNLSDIFAESGIVSCFIGIDGNPKTINGGYRDQNSLKSVRLRLSNLDTSYRYIKVYYSRESGDIDLNGVCEYKEIVQEFEFTNETLEFRISGLEQTITISETDLNLKYFNLTSTKALAQCQNRLFFGNIKVPSDDVKELTDLSLHFTPQLICTDKTELIGNVNTNTYLPEDNNSEYYSSLNIYNKVGYWNEEFYRFGIVYIYANGGLSNVYNVRGITELKENSKFKEYPIKDYQVRKYIDFDVINYNISGTLNENAAGVVRIVDEGFTTEKVYSIKFNLDNSNDTIKRQFIEELQKHDIIGFFFVRQKRIPTILCLAVVGNQSTDSYQGNEVSIPLLPDNYYETFLDIEGKLTQSYQDRLVQTNSVSSNTKYAICPEYTLNEARYNELFSGSSFKVKEVGQVNYTSVDRHYSTTNSAYNESSFKLINILGIPDDTKIMAINNAKFVGIAGTKEDAYRVGYVRPYHKRTKSKDYEEYDLEKGAEKFKNEQDRNMVRGIYNSRLGLYTSLNLTNKIINIYIPEYDIRKNLSEYFKLRYEDKSPYYAINQRFGIEEYFDLLKENNKTLHCYRGDCFICNFTWRMNRNFQDNDAPLNDVIVDDETYLKYYTTDPKWIEQLANINRTDVNSVQLGSWITVKLCCSRNISLRSLDKSYPSEKALYNHDRGFYPLTPMSASSDWKIPESKVLNDGYGKTVSHRINNKLENVRYLNTDFTNRIIYSNIKNASSFSNAYRVFPMTNYKDYNMERGAIVKFISLKNNIVCIFEHGIAIIPVQERVLTAGQDGAEVYLNSKNVLPERLIFISTLYGSLFADSVIKVDSDRIYGVDSVAKKVWMIADNLLKLISDLIVGEFLNENLPLKEHDVSIILGSKNIKTHYNSAKGDVMFTFYIPDETKSKHEVAWNLCYNDLQQTWVTFYSWIPLQTACVNNVMYSFNREYGRLINYVNKYSKDFNLKFINTNVESQTIKIINLLYKAHQSAETNEEKKRFLDECNMMCRLAFHLDTINDFNIQQAIGGLHLVCDNKIYKHGFGGIIDNQEKITPCKWYKRQHPFEFEFIVNDTPAAHKIFNNMRLLSNKTKPESFHYEIIGECFDFADDKANMYYRQEAKKELFRNLGSNISFDSKYYDITPIKNFKSTDTQLYYTRQDIDEYIDDKYIPLTKAPHYDYRHLSGTEIVHYPKLNEYRLWEHSKAVDMKDGGRLRGNMQYLEDCWNIQINPIVITEKNENWHHPNNLPPMTLGNSKIPNDLTHTTIINDNLPELYQSDINSSIDVEKWNGYKEIKIKDKWMKVKIRYSGEDLALISALYTMYSISYA